MSTSQMTTEAALRSALEALVCRFGIDRMPCWCVHDPTLGYDEGHDEGCRAARAALALPVEERMEYRVAFERLKSEYVNSRWDLQAENCGDDMNRALRSATHRKEREWRYWLPLETPPE